MVVAEVHHGRAQVATRGHLAKDVGRYPQEGIVDQLLRFGPIADQQVG